MDDLVEDSPKELAVGNLAEDDAEHVHADEDVWDQLEFAFGRDLAADDGALEYLAQHPARTFEDLVLESGSEFRVAGRGSRKTADDLQHPPVALAEVGSAFDQRLDVSQQRSRVGRLDRGHPFAPRDDGIRDEGGFRGPAAIERSFAGMGPRCDLVHAQPVVAELRETLERGAQDRRTARPIEAPAAASDPASCRRFVMVGHDLYDTEPYRTDTDDWRLRERVDDRGGAGREALRGDAGTRRRRPLRRGGKGARAARPERRGQDDAR